MTEPGPDRSLTLWSDGLLSKWGFGDGDMPDDVTDWLEADGVRYEDIRWHPVLIRLVRKFLLPKLDQAVQVEEVDTIHNPIRATTVDGVDVTQFHYGEGSPPRLTPGFVTVPYPEILRIVRELMPEASHE